jgi:dTDP-glucose pyrophosphorylase
VLVMLGDIIPTDFLLADMVRGCPRHSMLGVNEADDPTRCAVVETDNKGWYLDHKEKPENPKSNKTLSGCFYFKDASAFYELQHSLMLNKIRSHRGEYDILDTIKQMFRQGESFKCIDNAVLDCGSFEGIAEAEDYFAKNNVDRQ